MSLFVRSTPAPHAKTKNVRVISLALAGVLVVMAVAQLFTFEKFPGVITSIWLPGGPALAPMRAALIVTFEVMALLFLLSMRLSPAMRVVSMVAGWLVVAAWLAVALWENLTVNTIANAGLLGATVPVPVGWWSVFFAIALGILTGWASWGMWPLRRGKTA